MTLLNDATAIYAGDIPALRVYAGDVLVWEQASEGEWGPDERMLDPAITPSLIYTGDYTTGVRFTVLADGRITHFANHNVDVTGTARMRLYDHADPFTVLVEVPVPLFYGAQVFPLPEPIPVLAGHTYTVSFYNPVGGATTYPYIDAETTPVPISLSPNLIDMVGTFYNGDTYPTDDGDQYYWLDVIYQEALAASSPWEEATQAYLDATGLPESFAPALDGLVTRLKDTGLWAKMRAVYPFIGGTADLHKWNLLDPRDADDAFRLTFIEGSAPGGHSEALGYRPNALGAWTGGGFADTHFIPAAHLDVNSTHLAMYSLEDTPPGDRAEMGNFSYSGADARFHIIANYQGVNAFYYGQSEHGTSNIPVPASSGLFVATRTAADWQGGYRNGVILSQSGNPPNAGLAPDTTRIGAITNFANHSDMTFGFASIGDGLVAQDVTDLNLIVTDYQTALGRRPALTGFW